MTDAASERNRLATVFGGSGFLGRHIVRALVSKGWRVRVAVRRPDLAWFLRPMGGVGQIEPVQANLRFPDSIAAALEGASVAVNATGVKAESGAQTYAAVHIEGALALARAAAGAGLATMCIFPGSARTHRPLRHISRARGEASRRRAMHSPPRPSCARRSCSVRKMISSTASPPWLAICLVLPLLGGGETRLQPVYVGDVGEAAAAAVSGVAKPGAVYELGGPRTMTLREAAELALRAIDRRRLLVSLPLGPSRWIAASSQFAARATFGLFPKLLTTSRDQVELLASDNVVSAAAEAEGRVLRGLGVEPQDAEAIIPSYLVRFRRTGQYEVQRSA